MYSWVCASTPVVTRIITRAVVSSSAQSRLQPGDLVGGVDDDAADAALEGQAQFRLGLVVAVHADPRRVEAGAQRDGELAERADVEVQPLLGCPAGDGPAQEGLARVVHRPAGEGLAPVAGTAAEVDLVDHIGRGADLFGKVGEPDTADGDDAVGVARDGFAPQLRGKGVHILRPGQPDRGRGRRVGVKRARHVHVSHGRNCARERPSAAAREPDLDVAGTGEGQAGRVGDRRAVRCHGQLPARRTRGSGRRSARPTR